MSETTNLKLFKHDNPATNENQFDVTKALNNNWDKLDKFAGTTNTKITENQNNIKSLQTDNITNKQDIATLKSDNTTNKQDIANLKTENEELKAENERLNQDLNALPSNTAEGEYITLTDSADSRFNKFKVLGKSEQKVTELGVNVWSDNTTRTFDSSHRVQSVNLKPNIKAGTYKFSCDISNLVLGTNTGLHLASEIVYEDDSTDGSFYLIPFNAIKENTRYSNSITIEKNIKSISLKVGATQTTNGGSMTVSNFCLRADDSDEYVEFVPDSPSPNYSSEIRNLGDNINYVGGELTKGYYNATGTLDGDTGLYRCFKASLKKGTYTYSYNADLSFVRQVNLTNSTNLSIVNRCFTLEEDSEISFSFRKTNGADWDLGETLEDIQFKIEKGRGSTAYSTLNKGNINIYNCNENLFLNGFATPKNRQDFWESTSSRFIPLEDGWGRFFFTNNGSSINYIGAYSNLNFWRKIIKPSTQYKIILEFRNAELAEGDSFGLLDANAYSAFVDSFRITSEDISGNNKLIKTVTTRSNLDNCRFLFRSFMSVLAGNTSSIEVRASLIEANSTEAEVKVENQEFIFPLSEGQKMYEESYLASDGIHHKRKQVKLIPSDWTTNMPLSGTFYFSNSSSHIWDYTGLKGICTHFQNAENENVTENYSARNYLEDNQCNVRNADTKDRIYFKNSAFTTVEQWRNFFNNNDVLFEYECEEYVEAYTDEQQAVYDEIVKTAKSYKTVTNIFSTNEVSPKFEVEYRQDIKSLINNVSQAVLNNA